jgi:flagellar capping protein FliD
MTTDERLDRIELSIENLARSTESLTRYVLDFRTETINRFQMIDTRLDVLSATVASLDSRMAPLTKAILDFGAVANRLQVEQSRLAKLVEPAA